MLCFYAFERNSRMATVQKNLLCLRYYCVDEVSVFVISGVATGEQQEWTPLREIPKF